MSYIWYGLATSLAYPSGEEGGNFLVQTIAFARLEEGGGTEPLCGLSTWLERFREDIKKTSLGSLVFNPLWVGGLRFVL